MKRPRFSLAFLFFIVTYCAIGFAVQRVADRRHDEQQHRMRLGNLQLQLANAVNNRNSIARNVKTPATDPQWLKADAQVLAIKKQLKEEFDREP